MPKCATRLQFRASDVNEQPQHVKPDCAIALANKGNVDFADLIVMPALFDACCVVLLSLATRPTLLCNIGALIVPSVPRMSSALRMLDIAPNVLDGLFLTWTTVVYSERNPVQKLYDVP